MRHTMLAALGISGAGFVIALVLGHPLVALGIVLGFGLIVLNFRLMDRAVAKVHVSADPDKAAKKAARNQIARASSGRLGLATVAVVGTFIISKDLGLGTAIGAAASQLMFVLNAYGVVAKEGVVVKAGEQNV